MQEGFDLAIRIATLTDSSLIAPPRPIRHVVCASPACLARHLCLAYSNVRDPGLWSYRSADGRPGQVHVPARLAASSGEFLMQAALAGEGLVLLPTFLSMMPCAPDSWCNC